MTDIPTHVLEERRKYCLKLIDLFSGDLEARRTLLAINAELARRRRPPEVQKPPPIIYQEPEKKTSAYDRLMRLFEAR